MKRKKVTNCKNKRLIGPYLDGQLGECRWLDEHIYECSECLAEYESIQRIKHLVRRLDFSPPESFYWKNFPSRVSARIATRQSQSFITRIRAGISGRKFVIRILTPLIAVMVTVFALKMIYQGEWLPRESESRQADDQIITPGDYSGVSVSPAGQPDIAEDTQVAVSDIAGELLQQSDVLPVVDNNLVKKSDGVSQTVVTADEGSGDFEDVFDRHIFKILDSRYRQVGYRPGNLVGVDLNIIGGYGVGHLTSFSYDQVIKYQIFAGSNSSMVPLSSYREAAGKFFAPKISVYSSTYNQTVSSYWGFASGDNKYDSKKLHRLMLELNLSREK